MTTLRLILQLCLIAVGIAVFLPVAVVVLGWTILFQWAQNDTEQLW